jgi:hypothetical protein
VDTEEEKAAPELCLFFLQDVKPIMKGSGFGNQGSGFRVQGSGELRGQTP